ncbi:MAG: hypothetical protein ACYS76_01980 [Planctomycetota bacterium]|jgi:DNA-binding CsgD family transcriptional regulator
MFTTRQLLAIKQMYKLTDREIQVVRLISEGVESNAEIAERPGTSLHTARAALLAKI